MMTRDEVNKVELVRKSLDAELARLPDAGVPGNLVWRARRASAALERMIGEVRSLHESRDNALAALQRSLAP